MILFSSSNNLLKLYRKESKRKKENTFIGQVYFRTLYFCAPRNMFKCFNKSLGFVVVDAAAGVVGIAAVRAVAVTAAAADGPPPAAASARRGRRRDTDQVPPQLGEADDRGGL